VLKPIHKVQPGDLVRRCRYTFNHPPGRELFLVMGVLGPDRYRNCAFKTHEMTLVLWEVSEPQGHHSQVPMNLYEVP
jgi:hypothetical protein